MRRSPVARLNKRNNSANEPLHISFSDNTQRMTISGAGVILGGPRFATARAGNIGIETPNPLTLLHMGGEGASGEGWRNRMDIGIYHASRANTRTSCGSYLEQWNLRSRHIFLHTLCRWPAADQKND